MANPLFFPAVGMGAVMIYLMYSKTKRVDSGVTTPPPGVTNRPVLRQYMEPDDAWSNPLNLTSNKAYSPVIRVEAGQFGVPRTILAGPGDSEIIVQGDYYHSL